MAEFIANYLDSLRRQESASEMISSTSRHVWDALAAADIDPWMTPDASLDRSVPDYHEDRMSHDDDYYSSRRGLDWWDEKAESDGDLLAADSLHRQEACERLYEAKAAKFCVDGNGPGGRKNVAQADCMAMWADGVNSAREGVTRPGNDHESATQLSAQLGWSAGDQGGVEAGIGGSHTSTTTKHDPTSTREEDLVGAEGYRRKCASLTDGLFDAEVARLVKGGAE